MQFIAILSATMALLAGSNAAPTTRDDTHITDFHLFDFNGCKTGNEGVVTLLKSDATGACTWLDQPDEYLSVLVNDLAPGCTLTFYDSADCSPDAFVGTANQCINVTRQFAHLQAYTLKC